MVCKMNCLKITGALNYSRPLRELSFSLRGLWDVDRFCGAIAQLGERNTGSVEVGGSIPPSSTNTFNH